MSKNRALIAAHSLDRDQSVASTLWTRAYCSTWNELVNGSADLVDLADWADALYLTDEHLDPRAVARAAFEESERCG